MNKKTFTMLSEYHDFFIEYMKKNQLQIFSTSYYNMHDKQVHKVEELLSRTINNNPDEMLYSIKQNFEQELIYISARCNNFDKNIDVLFDKSYALHFHQFLLLSLIPNFSGFRKESLSENSPLVPFVQFIQSLPDEKKILFTKTICSLIPNKTYIYNVYALFNKDDLILDTILKTSLFKNEIKNSLPSLTYFLDLKYASNTSAELYIQAGIDSDNDFIKSLMLNAFEKSNIQDDHPLYKLKSSFSNKKSEVIDVPSFKNFNTSDTSSTVFWEHKLSIPFNEISKDFLKQNINLSHIFDNMYSLVVERTNSVTHVFHCSLVNKNLVFHTILEGQTMNDIQKQLDFINLDKFNPFFLGIIIGDFQDKNNRYSCATKSYLHKNNASLSIAKMQNNYLTSTASIFDQYRERCLLDKLNTLDNKEYNLLHKKPKI